MLLVLGCVAATPFRLSDRLADVDVERDGGETVLAFPEGTRLTLEEFAAALERARGDRPAGRAWWQRVLDITSPLGAVWVAVGLGGQALFTGRMLVQWLASEREQRSVVPEAFWWMSLMGASMLLAYFAWRVDVVGMIGQATGWGVYVRNLWLIRRKPVIA